MRIAFFLQSLFCMIALCDVVACIARENFEKSGQLCFVFAGITGRQHSEQSAESDKSGGEKSAVCCLDSKISLGVHDGWQVYFSIIQNKS